MIEIVYTRDKKKLSVTCKGHARSGVHGQDLVCAAVTALVYTIASDVQMLCENKKQVRSPVTELEPGDARISCRPVHGMEYVVALIFDSLCNGFALLQEQYPEYIRYKVVG